MALRVIGAGLGRTGTRSLKVALERLLGAPCYHMEEVSAQPGHIELWHQALRGNLPEWDQLLDGYKAAVDWPASAFWRELTAAYPDAVVVLSVRKSPEVWWNSVSQTIFHDLHHDPSEMDAVRAMFADLMRARFTDRWHDPDAAMAAYTLHYDAVRADVPAERLVQWKPEDGWQPICMALGLAVPNEPFPHLNTREEYWAYWDGDGPGSHDRPQHTDRFQD